MFANKAIHSINDIAVVVINRLFTITIIISFREVSANTGLSIIKIQVSVSCETATVIDMTIKIWNVRGRISLDLDDFRELMHFLEYLKTKKRY